MDRKSRIKSTPKLGRNYIIIYELVCLCKNNRTPKEMYCCFSTKPRTSAVPAYFSGVIVVKSLGLILSISARSPSISTISIYVNIFFGCRTGGCQRCIDWYVHIDLQCTAMERAKPRSRYCVDTPQVQERASQSQLVWYGLWCRVHQPLAQEAKQDTGEWPGQWERPFWNWVKLSWRSSSLQCVKISSSLAAPSTWMKVCVPPKSMWFEIKYHESNGPLTWKKFVQMVISIMSI